MPAHARAAVISMEARAKKGDDTYRLTDPEVKKHTLDLDLTTCGTWSFSFVFIQ